MATIKVVNEGNWANINGSKYAPETLAFIDTEDDEEKVAILHFGIKVYEEPYTEFLDGDDEGFASVSALITYLSTMGDPV